MPEVEPFLTTMKRQAWRQKPQAVKAKLEKGAIALDLVCLLLCCYMRGKNPKKTATTKHTTIWIRHCRRVLVTCSRTYFWYKEVSQPCNDRSRLNPRSLDNLSSDISNKLQCVSKSRICILNIIQAGILNLRFLSQQIAHWNDPSHSSNGKRRKGDSLLLF